MAKRDERGRFQRNPAKDTPLLKKARERFKLANDSDVKQADREREDLAFYAGEQWPADILALRQGQQPTNGMPSVPARPTLVINKMREPVRQLQNEIRDSDIGVELTPADDFGDLGITPDDTEVTLREGLVRRTIRNSNAQDAWNWGGDRAAQAGRGYFAILTRYLPGKTSDQEIYLDRIFNQGSVKGDPSRTEPDGSDAQYWFWGRFMLADQVAQKWPKMADGAPNPICDYNDQDFMGSSEQYPNWYRQEGSGDNKLWAVRIENYAYLEMTSREVVTLSDGTSVWADELPDELPDGVKELDRHLVEEPQAKLCVIAGGCVELENYDLPGPDLPIVEIVGEELQPYDDERRVEGMVRNAIGAQRGENYLISKFVESVGLSQIPRDRIDPDAIDGYEDWWKLANTRALPYLPYRTRDDQGNEFRMPIPATSDPNILPMAQGIAMFDQFIKSTTAIPDPTLGNVDPSLKSGRAIRETVMNAKASTSNFISNRMRSIQRACEIVNNMLYPVYGGRPGRLVRIMTGEGQPESMVIGDPEQMQQQAQVKQKALKVAKLTKDAKFNVAVKITKNYDTKRQQENSELGQLIGSEPTLMTWFGDLYFSSSDIPGRKQLAKRTRVMLDPKIQQMIAAEEQGQQVDPASMAKIQQLTERLQMAEQAMQELDAIANGKKLEAQTKLQIEQMTGQKDVALEQIRQHAETERAQVDLEKARMDNATKLRVAEIAAETKGIVSAQAMEHEAISLAHEQEHEATLAAEQQEHESRVSEQAQAHEAAEAERGRASTADENERNRQAAAEQGAST